MELETHPHVLVFGSVQRLLRGPHPLLALSPEMLAEDPSLDHTVSGTQAQVDTPPPTLAGGSFGLLPCSSLSFAGTSAAGLEWAHNPTAAAPSGSAAAPAGQNPGDRPCQGFPPGSSSRGSNSIRTFRFLQEAKP